MSKLIVTHHHPDLDGAFASWLLVRFLKDEFGGATFAFVPAGRTYKDKPVDADPHVVHVDTGLGRFDHHDTKREKLSASSLVLDFIIQQQPHLKNDAALRTMCDFVTEIDHFGEYYWDDPLNSRNA